MDQFTDTQAPEQQVSLAEPTTDIQHKVSLGPPQPQPPTPGVAADKAFMFHQGLGDVLGKTYGDIHATISQGKEQDLRNDAASKLNYVNILDGQRRLQAAATSSPDPLSREQVKAIVGSTAPIRPESVAEQGVAKRYINILDQGSENTAMEEAYMNSPEHAQFLKDTGEGILTYRQFALTALQNAQESVRSQSWPGFIADQAKEAIPFYSEAKLRGFTDTSRFYGLLGSNLEAQADDLYNLPFDQFKAKFSAIMEKLMKDNPSEAVRFASVVVGRPSDQKFLDNTFSALNLVTPPGGGAIVKGALRKAGLIAATETGVKSMVKNISNVKEMTEAALHEAAGNADEAAVKKATTDVVKEMAGVADSAKESREGLTSVLNAQLDAVEARPGRFGQEIVNRIKESVNSTKINLMNAIQNIVRVNRVPELVASEDAIRAIKDEIKQLYKGISNSISDIVGPLYDNGTNTYWTTIHFTNADGTLFDTKEQAANWASRNGFKDYSIGDSGSKHYVMKLHPLTENSQVARDLYFRTDGKSILDKSPEFGWIKSVLSWIRTPEDTLAKQDNLQRQIATHGPSILLNMAREESKKISKLPGKYWNDWKRAIDFAKEDIHPKTGDKGHFFEDPQAMDDWYQRNIGRNVQLPEIEAYFAYVRNYEVDRIYRSLLQFSHKARQGVERHRLWIPKKDFDPQVPGSDKNYTDWFDGIRMDHIPSGTDGIYFVGKGGQEVYLGGEVPKSVRQAYEKRLSEGSVKAFEVYAPEHFPLKGWGKAKDKYIRYVIAENTETKDLSVLDQIPRREGGHFEYDYEHYIKQAKMSKSFLNGRFQHRYLGDTTIMPMSIRAMGQDVVKHLNAVRELIKAKDMDGAKAYNAAHLPIPWAEHKGWYFPKKDPNGNVIDPFLDLDEPIQLTNRNQKIADMGKDALEMRHGGKYEDGGKFIDGTRSGSKNQQSLIQYTKERDARDLYTINDKGTKGNPLYSYEPARFVDPIATMNRGLNSIVNSMFMDDLKINAIEHWVAEASNWLKAGVDQLKYSPFAHFGEIGPSSWKPGTPQNVINRLMANRFKIRQFIGTPSKVETFLHGASQTLLDSMYKRFGPRTAEIVNTYALPYVKDPLVFMRSMVFDMKLGLFSIPQFFTQLTTYSNVMAIAGLKHAPGASAATMFHWWARMNKSPEVLAKLDSLATNFGFRPGEWSEAKQWLENTGFANVGTEHAVLDTVGSNRIITRGGRSFLDWGRVPFKAGASNTRVAAWYTAYKEFRAKTPTGALSRENVADILKRAANLDHNMSRAANSPLHTGAMAPLGQFLAYPLRLAELMWGKRLTTQEKMRLFGVSSILYGVPLGGVGLFGFPFGDQLKQYAKDAGYVPGDNFWASTLMQGVPAAMTAMITGGGDPQKGNWYDYDKWAAKGFDPGGDLLSGDKTMWDIFGGASFETGAMLWKQSSGLRRSLWNTVYGGQEDFPLKIDDFKDILTEISSVNYTWRTLAAIHTGRWLSKNETYLEDTSPLKAIFMGTTGLVDQRVADLTITQDAIKRQEQAEKDGLNHFIKEMHRAFIARRDGNEEQAQDFERRARVWLEVSGYPVHKRSAAAATAGRDWESLVKRSERQYYMEKVPAGKEGPRQETYTNILRMEQ